MLTECTVYIECICYSKHLFTLGYDNKFQFLVFAIFRTDKKENNA